MKLTHRHLALFLVPVVALFASIAQAGSEPLSAAHLTKSMFKFPGAEFKVVQSLSTNMQIANIGAVKAEVHLVDRVVGNPDGTAKDVRQAILATSDGVNTYYFIVAEGANLASIKNVKQGVSSYDGKPNSVVEIDLEQAAKSVELNIMLLSTEREVVTNPSETSKVFHVAMSFDKYGYRRAK